MKRAGMRISDTLDSLEDLIAHAQELISYARLEGADEAEVYGIAGRSVDIDLRRDVVELASESHHSGLGLRAVVAGAVGFSSTSDMSLLRTVARSAVQSARARGGDPSWCSLPFPAAVRPVDGVFDPHLADIGPEVCLDLAKNMLSGCRNVPGAEPVSGGVSCALGGSFVLNTRGVELQENGTLMHASMECIARRADVATGSEFFIRGISVITGGRGAGSGRDGLLISGWSQGRERNI